MNPICNRCRFPGIVNIGTGIWLCISCPGRAITSYKKKEPRHEQQLYPKSFTFKNNVEVTLYIAK